MQHTVIALGRSLNCQVLMVCRKGLSGFNYIFASRGYCLECGRNPELAFEGGMHGVPWQSKLAV